MVQFAGWGLLTVEGEEWKRARIMAKPMFKREMISDFGFLKNSIDRLIDEIPSNNEAIDMLPKFYNLVSVLVYLSTQLFD